MSAAASRVLALGQAARDAFARGDVEEGSALIEERGRAIAGLTSFEIGRETYARLQSEDIELRRSATRARDEIGADLRRLARSKAYPAAG